MRLKEADFSRVLVKSVMKAGQCTIPKLRGGHYAVKILFPMPKQKWALPEGEHYTNNYCNEAASFVASWK
jgi:hypothetical protein